MHPSWFIMIHQTSVHCYKQGITDETTVGNITGSLVSVARQGTSLSYKMNKFWGSDIQHGACS